MVSVNPFAGNRLSPKDLERYLTEIKDVPKEQKAAQLKQLLEAGEARLPEGAAAKLRAALHALATDGFAAGQAPQRPAQPTSAEASIARFKATENGQLRGELQFRAAGKAAPGSTVQVFNYSRPGQPLLGEVPVNADGSFGLSFDSNSSNHFSTKPLFWGDQVALIVKSPTGALSEPVVLPVKPVEVLTTGGNEIKRVDIPEIDAQAPFVATDRVATSRQLATKDDPAVHMMVNGRAGSTEPNARVEAVIDGQVQHTSAGPDGSFAFDVRGAKPGTELELRFIDRNGQVGSMKCSVPALRFDSTALVNSSQGVPYDRFGKDGKADPNGPFVKFSGPVVDAGTVLTVKNNTTGESFTAVADAGGKLEVELSNTHAGDSLSFTAADAAGNPAGINENYVIPAQGRANPKVTEILCYQTLLSQHVDELIGLVTAQPTSVHREAVEKFLADGAHGLQKPADQARLEAAMAKLYSGSNDIRSQARNPDPKEPIVIAAKIIKPRVMDSGSVARDPLEVTGTAEPFSTVEIRNASRQNAQVIGSVRADKDGNFKFVSTNESLFVHGDQLLVRANDQGGSKSSDALAHSCAYELQVWNATGRTELVQLPKTTDARDPFLDQGKLAKQDRLPITATAAEQVFRIAGGPQSAEPGAVVRVTNLKGQTYETQVAKDGSFTLDVGKFTPGETLTAKIFDVNGRVIDYNVATSALRFDHGKLTASSQGVPYQRFDVKGNPDKDGPFLAFKADAVVDPHSKLTVTNNTTGESFSVQADAAGNLQLELPRVHAGDSLALVVTDPAGNVSPSTLENYVVPGTATYDAELTAIRCQHVFNPEDTSKIHKLLERSPTAANRQLVEELVNGRPEAFADPKDLTRLKGALAELFGKNDVRVWPEVTAPKPPIVIDADVIKPRAMDGGSAQRDPLELRGTAEPFSTVEIRNGSRDGYPLIGTVRADKAGKFQFTSTNESLFLHGDQLIVKATDQGGTSSDTTLSRTCAYELQVWNNPPRTQKVKLPDTTDTRDPFLNMSKVTSSAVAVTASTKARVYRLEGGAGSAEAGSVVRATNKKGEVFEAQVSKDGSFKLEAAYTPGEALALAVVDAAARIVTQQVQTPAVKFDTEGLLQSSQGVPYGRNVKGAADPAGPFLWFGGAGLVDPFSKLTLKNNSTGQVFTAQADAAGKLDLEIGGVHVGDSLTMTVADPAGNAAPGAVTNWVVPAQGRVDARLSELLCQATVLTPHAQEIVARLTASPTSVNYDAVSRMLVDHPQAFAVAADKKAVSDALMALMEKNNVHTEASNPAPKEPIVIGAKIIKPRVMDQGSTAGRDPLEITGTAEPYTTIEVRNASRDGAPAIGTVRADEKGEFKFVSTNESLFLHGDQLLLKVSDQGGAVSGEKLARACAYELRIWNSENRTETVHLPESTDTRDPFLNTAKVKNAQTIAVAPNSKTFTTLIGDRLSAEPGSIVRVTTSTGKVCETQVKADGSFKLDVSDYLPGETLTAHVFDAAGRTVQQQFATAALPFAAEKLTQGMNGPPYQKAIGGKPIDGGPFLEFKAEQVTFPGAKLTVTNHATGVVFEAVADAKGGFAFELPGVHAHDLLSFKVADAAGNAAPQAINGWQVPAVPHGENVDPVVNALTNQRPMTGQHVQQLIGALEAQPTLEHRAAVNKLMHEHPNWFAPGELKKLQDAVAEIWGKDFVERIPDLSNPAPQIPVVLGAEIVKPRAMDGGSAPRDPLRVTGLAEPLSWVEIYNGSVPGRPQIGRVQTNADGKFAFESNDESKFVHNDKIVVMAADAGQQKSSAVVVDARSYELQIWSTGRRDKVRLEGADARDPFLDTGKLKTERDAGNAANQNSFMVIGAAGASEPFATVEVKVGEAVFKAETGVDGDFKLPVVGLTPGQPIAITVTDEGGRKIVSNYTPAVA